MPDASHLDNRHSIDEHSSTMTPEEQISAVTVEFRHEINVRTRNLFYMLEGAYLLNQRITKSGLGPDTQPGLQWPRMRGFPLLNGEPLEKHTRPDGLMQAMAFKAWVIEVYDCLWESHFRNRYKQAYDRMAVDAIRPLTEPLGDLRLIRNNLLHGGVATKDGALACKVLRWFHREGEPIRLRLGHVLDFLNQLGMLADGPLFVGIGTANARTSSWYIDRREQRYPGETGVSIARLVSVRPMVDKRHEDSRHRYFVCIVFEDGLYSTVPMGPESADDEKKDPYRSWLRVTVDDKGDLLLPGHGAMSASDLYLRVLRGKSRRGPGVWGPWMKFREPK